MPCYAACATSVRWEVALPQQVEQATEIGLLVLSEVVVKDDLEKVVNLFNLDMDS